MTSFATSITTRMQFLDHFRSGLISQLIRGISRVLQKLHRYFSGTIDLTFSVPLSAVLPAFFFFRSVIELA